MKVVTNVFWLLCGENYIRTSSNSCGIQSQREQTNNIGIITPPQQWKLLQLLAKSHLIHLILYWRHMVPVEVAWMKGAPWSALILYWRHMVPVEVTRKEPPLLWFCMGVMLHPDLPYKSEYRQIQYHLIFWGQTGRSVNICWHDFSEWIFIVRLCFGDNKLI